MPDIPNKEENGVICFGTTGVSFPYSFVEGGKYVGLDVKMAGNSIAITEEKAYHL